MTKLTATLGGGLMWIATLASAQQVINEGMDGAWFNPATPGQGILVDVDEDFFFLAWFTYDPMAVATDGEDAHRWYTAQGRIDRSIDDSGAELALFETRGGFFNSASETVTEETGTASISFSTCTNADFSYAFSGGRSGSFALERLAPDVLCEPLSPPDKTVTVTYLGNAGVFIDDGDEGILIDAFANFSGWIDSPASLKTALRNADPPYDRALVMAATHNHGDHLVSSQANGFLGNQPEALALVPNSARGNFAAARRVELSPARFDAVSVPAGEFMLTVINTRHFNQFGNDFSDLENYAYLVEISGQRILHTGDIDYASDNFQAIIDAIGAPPDALILPTFNTLISARNRDLVTQFFPGSQVVATHFRSGSLAAERNQLLAQFPDAVVFDQAQKTFTMPEN